MKNILSYIIIESKMQHFSLPKKYIYTKNQNIDFFTCIKKCFPKKKKNLHKIYFIYYTVITLLWYELGTITYNSQLLFSFFT